MKKSPSADYFCVRESINYGVFVKANGDLYFVIHENAEVSFTEKVKKKVEE